MADYTHFDFSKFDDLELVIMQRKSHLLHDSEFELAILIELGRRAKTLMETVKHSANSMTPDEIDALTPEQLRVAVAVQVMGLNVISESWPCKYPPDGCGLEAAMYPDSLNYPVRWPVYATVEDYKHEVDGDTFYDVEPVPDYPNDIRAAWTVVEKFNLMDSDDLYNELDQVVPLIGLSASDA